MSAAPLVLAMLAGRLGPRPAHRSPMPRPLYLYLGSLVLYRAAILLPKRSAFRSLILPAVRHSFCFCRQRRHTLYNTRLKNILKIVLCRISQSSSASPRSSCRPPRPLAARGPPPPALAQRMPRSAAAGALTPCSPAVNRPPPAFDAKPRHAQGTVSAARPPHPPGAVPFLRSTERATQRVRPSAYQQLSASSNVRNPRALASPTTAAQARALMLPSAVATAAHLSPRAGRPSRRVGPPSSASSHPSSKTG